MSDLEPVEPDEYPEAQTDLPINLRSAVAAVRIRNEYHAGPIPSAKQMAAYEELVPGAAERLLAMAERKAEEIAAESKAVIALQHRELSANAAIDVRQFIVVLAYIVFCAWASYLNYYLGGFITLAGVAGVVTLYLKPSKHRE